MAIAQATQLMGAETVLVGVRPEVAQTIVGLGIHLGSMHSVTDLQAALAMVHSSTAAANHKAQSTIFVSHTR